MKHYVYKVTEKLTGEFYIGSRSCKCNTHEDSYMGSMITWKPNKANLHKEILCSTFDSRHDANLYEIKLITEFITDKLNRNFHIPGEDIDGRAIKSMLGKVHKEESKSKMKISRKIYLDSEQYKNTLPLLKTKLSKLAKDNKIGWGHHPNIENPMKNLSVKDVWIKKYGIAEAEEKWKTKYENVKGRPAKNRNNKKIIQLLSGSIIKTYDGLYDVIAENPTFTKSNICRAIKTGGSTSGFKWKYETDNE